MESIQQPYGFTIVKIRTEVEKFRHHLPVLEILSSTRLRERHWEKMSEIVGFDLSLYANATVAQICELGLNPYLAKLKPIAFMADREGTIADQANYIIDFWTEAGRLGYAVGDFV